MKRQSKARLAPRRSSRNDVCAVSTRTRIEKLGVKAGADVLVFGADGDRPFMQELRDVGAAVRTSGTTPADMVFAAFNRRDDLRRLAALVPRLKPAGVLWTLRPKGSKDITEAEVRSAGLAAGLVDVKVVSFSDVLTAEKFVIPLASRPARSTGR